MSTREQEALELIERVRAKPLRFRDPQITMAHGAGGKATQAMIETLGPERTAVVVYLVQSSFDAVLIATAITPLFASGAVISPRTRSRPAPRIRPASSSSAGIVWNVASDCP